jgi:hypothetical protein
MVDRLVILSLMPDLGVWPTVGARSGTLKELLRSAHARGLLGCLRWSALITSLSWSWAKGREILGVRQARSDIDEWLGRWPRWYLALNLALASSLTSSLASPLAASLTLARTNGLCFLALII